MTGPDLEKESISRLKKTKKVEGAFAAYKYKEKVQIGTWVNILAMWSM